MRRVTELGSRSLADGLRFISLCLAVAAPLGGGFIAVGIMIAEQRVTNALAREGNATNSLILQRLSALEARSAEADRQYHEQIARLDEAVKEVDAMGDAVERHVRQEKSSRWWVLHRLDRIDNLGTEDRGGGR